MTDPIIFSAQLKQDNDKWVQHCAENYTLVPITNEQVQEIRKNLKSWERLDDRLEPDSDEESDFDEELLPVVRYNDEFDKDKEFYQRVSKCLAELEKLKISDTTKSLVTLSPDNAEEIEDWQTFDESSAEDIRQLRCQFLEKHPESVIVEPIILKSRFENIQRSLIMKKSKSYQDQSQLYVTFLFHMGCCSCSSVPMKIFKTFQHAQRHAKKLHNFAQAKFSKCHGGHGNDYPDRPQIHIFHWDNDKYVHKCEIKKDF